jgi:hypothetical protein
MLLEKGLKYKGETVMVSPFLFVTLQKSNDMIYGEKTPKGYSRTR